ncbi:MAG: hypothetical protein RLY86_1554 [Pseudomonadota bacterium]|jgi:hypothetical protein
MAPGTARDNGTQPEPARPDRRRVLAAGALTAGAIGTLLIPVPGIGGWLTPRQARAEGAPPRILTAQEVRTLEAFGDVLLPGAAADGIAPFVDSQLAVAAEDSLLMIRYLDAQPPYAAFYKAGLAALDGFARAAAGSAFADLDRETATGLAQRITKEIPPGWQGPPAPLVTFVIRSDAVDVVYGTEEGFARLDLPGMAHIPPPRRW